MIKGLRKITTLLVVFAVLFTFRIALLQLTGCGFSSSFLMKVSLYPISGSASQYSDTRFNLDLASNAYKDTNSDILQSKANVEDQKLDESLELLRNTSFGASIAKNLDKSGVKIVFGKPKTAGAAAVFVPNFIGNSGSIIVSERLKDEEISVITAILAHEGTHAKMNSLLGYNSVEQEYKCYVAQAEVWEEVKSSLSVSLGEYEAEIGESSPENDYAEEIKKMGKDKAFEQIWQDYNQIGIDLPLN